MQTLGELSGTVLVIGGARSGKSAFAEALFEGLGSAVYLATGEAADEEMRRRINLHRARRDDRWYTLEEPLDVIGRVDGLDDLSVPVLIDCLTIWLSNVLLKEGDADGEITRLGQFIATSARQLVCVTNEVGQGIVPDNALARRYRDLAGTMNQTIAAAADHVFLVTAGIPQKIK